jgi:hypothetical protein
MKRLACLVAVLAAISACADTTAPAPPATEVLLVVNSTEVSLSVVPVDDPAAAIKIPLGGVSATPVNVSALNGVAIVPMGLDNAVAVVDLITGTVARTIPLEANSGATGSAIVGRLDCLRGESQSQYGHPSQLSDRATPRAWRLVCSRREWCTLGGVSS